MHRSDSYGEPTDTRRSSLEGCDLGYVLMTILKADQCECKPVRKLLLLDHRAGRTITNLINRFYEIDREKS